MKPVLVLKLGGELLETEAQRSGVARFAAELAAGGHRLLLVHGAGRAIDAEMDRRGLEPRKIDGLRVTDAATLDAVVAVLAGSANTALVAALVGEGLAAVGLTGVDAGFGRASRSSAHVTTSGEVADLGFVGDPVTPRTDLLRLLADHGFVPVIASLGIDVGASDATAAPLAAPHGTAPAPPPSVLNVNADVMACRIAAALEADGVELVIAGGTPGVLDRDGRTLPQLDVPAIREAISSGTATAGMVAKLTACLTALESGVTRARIVNGRRFGAVPAADALDAGTLLVPVSPAMEAR